MADEKKTVNLAEATTIAKGKAAEALGIKIDSKEMGAAADIVQKAMKDMKPELFGDNDNAVKVLTEALQAAHTNKSQGEATLVQAARDSLGKAVKGYHSAAEAAIHGEVDRLHALTGGGANDASTALRGHQARDNETARIEQQIKDAEALMAHNARGQAFIDERAALVKAFGGGAEGEKKFGDIAAKAKSFFSGDAYTKGMATIHDHAETAAQHAAWKKANTDISDDAVKALAAKKEAAEKAAAAIAEEWNKLAGAHKDKELEALKLSAQAVVSKDADAAKMAKLAEHGVKIGGIGDMHFSDSFAKHGVKSGFTAGLGDLAKNPSGKMSNLGRGAVIAGTVAAGAAAVKVWNASSEKQDPDDPSKKKEGSVFGKVAAVALGALTIGLAVAAWKGENPMKVATDATSGATSWVKKTFASKGQSTGATRA